MKIEPILSYLGVEQRQPDLGLLNTLIAAYARKVPWETASRIVRRATIQNLEECPRWPDVFWDEAMRLGTGGTCFESNYAFFELICTLGFDGYLTINNMGETIGCHSAIVVRLDDQSYIVDAGFPIHAALPFAAKQVIETQTSLALYRTHAISTNKYDVERLPHPKPIAYTLIDTPVSETDYRTAATVDYGDNGLFLDQIIINKIVNEQQWRFASSAEPYHLECFHDGIREDVIVASDLVHTLYATFAIDPGILSAAFNALNKEPLIGV